MKTGRILIAAAVALPLAMFADIVYLNDGFDDGERDTQDRPDSAAWFASHTSALPQIVDRDGNNVVLVAPGQTTATPRGIVAYFTDEVGSPATLTPEYNILRYSFDFTPTDIGSNTSGLRFVILESDSRIDTDTLGNVTASGYGFMINPETGDITFRVREEETGNYVSTLGNYADMSGEVSLLALEADTAYSIDMDLELLLTGDVKLTAKISDGETTVSQSYTDETFKYTSFDTIGVAVRPEASGQVEFDNFRVVLIGEGLSFEDWAADYGLTGPDANPDLDFDGDGFTNMQEFIADTDPTDPDSFFSVKSVMRGESQSIVSFQSSSEREYELWFTPDLTGESGWEQVEGPRMGAGGEDSMIHETENESATGFYRLKVSLP